MRHHPESTRNDGLFRQSVFKILYSRTFCHSKEAPPHTIRSQEFRAPPEKSTVCCWWPVAPPRHWPCPAVSWPRIQRGLPRLPSRNSDSRFLGPATSSVKAAYGVAGPRNDNLGGPDFVRSFGFLNTFSGGFSRDHGEDDASPERARGGLGRRMPPGRRSTQVDFAIFQGRTHSLPGEDAAGSWPWRSRRGEDAERRCVPVADAQVQETPRTAGPPSPRRWTSCSCCGEFIRSARRAAMIPSDSSEHRRSQPSAKTNHERTDAPQPFSRARVKGCGRHPGPAGLEQRGKKGSGF
jgi:hypothetical protein